MDRYPTQKTISQKVFPHIEPFERFMLDVGQGHSLYVEQCGNPQGVPVVVVHGGPGGGCSPTMRRFFDPKIWRIILFDQRGCGRSRPHASVEHNTTWDLVSDMEQIRQALDIDKWAVFGGSWGATLSLIYAIKNPTRVLYLALRGVFLMMERELDWFYNGGAGQFWPDQWTRFEQLIPEPERDNLIEAYFKRLFSGDHKIEAQYAKVWAAWENALASFRNGGHMAEPPADYARAFARLENYYFINKGWLPEDAWILNNAHRIAHIPAVIVQGRYDMICPPKSAFDLAQALPKARLEMVGDAGHALSEPGIVSALVREMDRVGAVFSER